ncbi:MAG: hypothetical protein EZS28_027944 [Streblomastix strix]|uniref:Uncharacterized protein n=1 Tax=Streblomastix strix TaxID=222440 RepID=A0A5J4V1C0_9EUKA|nr:MAG: hypothetical protein EZS28_027944 [Streblomastix strix]
METMTNLSTQSNPSTQLTETMDSERMIAGRSYRPLSTEKQIPRSISQKYPPILYLTMQSYQMESEETAIDITSNENCNEQANDNRIGGQQNNQGSNNETQYEQDNGNTKLREIGSSHTTHSEQELRNPNISQPKGHPPLITTPPELGQVKGKVVFPKQMMQPTNDHDTRNKTCQSKPIPNKSLGSPEARANTDTLNHFIPKQEQRKKDDVAPVTQDKSAKHSKSYKTSAGSKKQKQGFNSENQIEIEPDSETDQLDQLDCVRKKRRKKVEQRY